MSSPSEFEEPQQIGETSPYSRVVHIFCLEGRYETHPDDEPFGLSGRFVVHDKRIAKIFLAKRSLLGNRNGEEPVLLRVRPDRATLPPRAVAAGIPAINADYTWEISRMDVVSTTDGLAQVHITTQHNSHADLAQSLGNICQDRLFLELKTGTGSTWIPLERVVRERVSQALSGRIADVHQQVVLHQTDASDVVDGGGVTNFARSLLARELGDDLPFRRSLGDIITPSGLNRTFDEACVHSRGVSVLVGQEPSIASAALTLESIMLMGLARVRSTRTELDAVLGELRTSGSRASASASTALRLSEQVRGLRLRLARDATVYLHGDQLPEVALDDLRRGVSSSLGLDELFSSTSALVDRLSEVAEGIRREVEMNAGEQRASRHLLWGTTVAVLTGLTLPIALLIGYFGMSAAEVDPQLSIFDRHRYWPVWLAALTLLCALLLTGMSLQRRTRIPKRRPLISAHRGGPEGDVHRENTLAAVAHSISVGAEIVEIDVYEQDGKFVMQHSTEFERDTPRLEQAFRLLSGHAIAQLDVKFKAGGPDAAPDMVIELAQLAFEELGARGFILTTADDTTAARICGWRSQDPMRHPVMVGLSLGWDTRGMPLWKRLWHRRREYWPGARFRSTGADLVVAWLPIARRRLIRWSTRKGMPILVWTPDSDSELTKTLADPRVWAVTTNFPSRALAIRSKL